MTLATARLRHADQARLSARASLPSRTILDATQHHSRTTALTFVRARRRSPGSASPPRPAAAARRSGRPHARPGRRRLRRHHVGHRRRPWSGRVSRAPCCSAPNRAAVVLAASPSSSDCVLVPVVVLRSLWLWWFYVARSPLDGSRLDESIACAGIVSTSSTTEDSISVLRPLSRSARHDSRSSARRCPPSRHRASLA